MIHLPVWKEIIIIYKINNKVLLQSTENYIQYLIKPIMEKNLKRYIYIYIYVCNPLQYSCLENPMDGGAW